MDTLTGTGRLHASAVRLHSTCPWGGAGPPLIALMVRLAVGAPTLMEIGVEGEKLPEEQVEGSEDHAKYGLRTY